MLPHPKPVWGYLVQVGMGATPVVELEDFILLLTVVFLPAKVVFLQISSEM